MLCLKRRLNGSVVVTHLPSGDTMTVWPYRIGKSPGSRPWVELAFEDAAGKFQFMREEIAHQAEGGPQG